tara:strand:+ start:152 stop:1009 length:858 start_codon:yes stop_codon:yes gene_type:complete
MATLGQKPATTHVSFQKQTITGNGGTSYTLQQSVGSELDIAVFINNTRQEPTTAYTASGTSLVMTGAVNSSDHFYVIFLAKAINTTGLPVSAVNTASINASAVTNDKIANSTIDLTSKVTGVLPAANSQTNAPAFHAYHTDNTGQSGVLTGLNNENQYIYKGNLTSINVNNVYSTSTGRFTPGVAGTYFCYATMSPTSGVASQYERTIIRFLKNGSKYPASTSEFDTSFSQDSAEPTTLPVHISMIVELDADDYLECQVFHDTESSFWEFKTNNCHFGGYKLIGI